MIVDVLYQATVSCAKNKSGPVPLHEQVAISELTFASPCTFIPELTFAPPCTFHGRYRAHLDVMDLVDSLRPQFPPPSGNLMWKSL